MNKLSKEKRALILMMLLNTTWASGAGKVDWRVYVSADVSPLSGKSAHETLRDYIYAIIPPVDNTSSAYKEISKKVDAQADKLLVRTQGSLFDKVKYFYRENSYLFNWGAVLLAAGLIYHFTRKGGFGGFAGKKKITDEEYWDQLFNVGDRYRRTGHVRRRQRLDERDDDPQGWEQDPWGNPAVNPFVRDEKRRR